jgi:SAM-dependent methyltransferase
MTITFRGSIDRSGLLDRLAPAEIVSRYRHNYGLGEEIGFEEVKKHAALEGELTDALLASSAGDRAEVFSRAYSRLYSEISWLAATGGGHDGELWAGLLRQGASVYEIGSGAGNLINYLASRGFKCVGTDIASERSAVGRLGEPGVAWAVTDGVRLTQFATPGSYDYVISDQVVEHLHPEDAILHFREARDLLKPGGEYIVRTPNALLGPTDLSVIFDCEEPVFMHLHEFRIAELANIAKEAGFSHVRAIVVVPKLRKAVKSGAFLSYMQFIDRLATHAWLRPVARLLLRKFHKYLLIQQNLWLSLAR